LRGMRRNIKTGERKKKYNLSAEGVFTRSTKNRNNPMERRATAGFAAFRAVETPPRREPGCLKEIKWEEGGCGVKEAAGNTCRGRTRSGEKRTGHVLECNTKQERKS